jgi:hypothetical protein
VAGRQAALVLARGISAGRHIFQPQQEEGALVLRRAQQILLLLAREETAAVM